MSLQILDYFVSHFKKFNSMTAAYINNMIIGVTYLGTKSNKKI